PVYIEIPMDVGNRYIDNIYTYHRSERLIYVAPNEILEEVLSSLEKSERPIILAGGGVISSRAAEDVDEFSTLLNIPILTTPSGRGTIPEDKPLAFGQVGLYRTKVSKRIYEEADLIIMLGTQFEEFQSASWAYTPKSAKIIQFDIDPLTINRNVRANIPVLGDIKYNIRYLIDIAKKRNSLVPESRNKWVKSMIDYKKDFENSMNAELNKMSVLRTPFIVNKVYKIFGKGTILANENGSQDVWSYYFPYYKVLDYYSTLGMPEQTGLSLGVTGAIGAKLTSPDKKVVCITGDGAFQFGMHEIATSMQYKAPVTWIILNNNGLGWEKYYQKYWLKSRKITNTEFTSQPDFVKIAEANGIYGAKVYSPDKVEVELQRALEVNVRDKISAILDFEVPTYDFPEGFHEFHSIVWGPPKYPIDQQYEPDD
ncbi:MAG: thiamine pyrophosphate-binding protein, partial [Thermoplasmatales archaeon]